MNTYLNQLIPLIQKGDLILTGTGHTMTVYGKPEKRRDPLLQRFYAAHNREVYLYIVAAQTDDRFQMPIDIYGIQQVQRGGMTLWDAEHGTYHTQPIQLSLFEG